MMILRAAATFVATLLAFSRAQSISDCATGCVSGVLANAAAMECTNGDTQCVCSQADNFHDGVRDCITGACPDDVAQIPLAITYGDGQCALLASVNTPAPTPASTSPVPDASPDALSSTPASTSIVATSSPSSSSGPLLTTTTTTPGDNTASPSLTSLSPSATEASTSLSPPPTAEVPQTPSSENEKPSTGLSTAVKAGIGAGVGVAALAVAVIAVCVCLRRRQAKKAANPARKLKISEPMVGSGSRYAYNAREAQSGPSKSIPATKAVAHADTSVQPTSPTSTYSFSSELESNARRYEDLMPRTQPRTMI